MKPSGVTRQLKRDTSNSQDAQGRLTSARRQYEVDIHTETLDGESSEKLGMDTALGSAGEPWSRALTTRRRGSERSMSDAIKQSQRHGRISAESPDESGQVTRTCNSSCNAAVNLKQLWRPSVDVSKRRDTLASSRVRGACGTQCINLLSTVPCISCRNCAEHQRQHDQVLQFPSFVAYAEVASSLLVVVLCGPRNFTRNEGSEVKNLTCHAPRSELVFEQLLVCRTRHDRDPEGNVSARICVKIRNRDLESGMKYLNPTLGCKDIKCMEYRSESCFASYLVKLFECRCALEPTVITSATRAP